VFGVESDEAAVCGVGDGDLIKARDRLAKLAWTLVTPSPVVEVCAYDVAGRTVLVMSVERGSSPPYGLKIGDRIEYYVRRDATTFPARPEDLGASASGGTLTDLFAPPPPPPLPDRLTPKVLREAIAGVLARVSANELAEECVR
jgi:hypothetical protein